MAASLILAASSHFVLTASSQKILDEQIPPERRRHIDRFSMESEDLSNEHEKENSTPSFLLSHLGSRITIHLLHERSTLQMMELSLKIPRMRYDMDEDARYFHGIQ